MTRPRGRLLRVAIVKRPVLLSLVMITAVASLSTASLSTAVSASPVGSGSERVGGRHVLIAAGDIACDPDSPYYGAPGLCQQDRVGRRVRIMVNGGADWFVPLGDVQYETGSYADFIDVYDKAFGAVRQVTRPVAGNHEYITSGARGYFRYFKKKAGNPDRPWRAFKAAPEWKVLLLDSNCEYVGGCGRQSRQGRWIKRELRSTSADCIIAAWHHPLQTSGEYAGSADSRGRARKLWRLVDDGGADIVLNGHDHIYERFAKRGGIQEFVVGTGGKNHYDITTKAPGSRKRIGDRYGVLRLTMRANGTYQHAFVTPYGKVFDSGHKQCTNEPG